MRIFLGLIVLVLCAGCSDRRGREGFDAGPGPFDASSLDSSSRDASPPDGADSALVDGSADGERTDGNAFTGDSGSGPDGSGGDVGREDDAGAADVAAPIFDAGSPDAGFDAGPGGGCVSGASGTHALRFTWDGSSSGSVASVDYDLNNLPDTSRWRVSAASMSIGYRPIFRDPFLGEGGLEVSGTVFIDVELSTIGLTSIRNVTIAIYGRSYNTTSSGSFTWQTFEGTGAAPSGSVSNSAPYEWYGANATTAFAAGDDGILLRLRAGPPSGALIVRRVEVCFDAS